VNIFAAGGAVTFGGMVISTEKPSPLMGEGLGGGDAGRHLDAHGADTVEWFKEPSPSMGEGWVG
jgi:hypothetical protein